LLGQVAGGPPFVGSPRLLSQYIRSYDQTESGAHPVSYPMGTVVIKRPEREDDHSPQSSAEIKNTWNYTPLPQYAFMAWCSVKAQGQLYLYLYRSI